MTLEAVLLFLVSKDRMSVARAGEIMGTLGALLRLHHLGLTSRDLEGDLRMLEAADMRIWPGLRRNVLEAARDEV